MQRAAVIRGKAFRGVSVDSLEVANTYALRRDTHSRCSGIYTAAERVPPTSLAQPQAMAIRHAVYIHTHTPCILCPFETPLLRDTRKHATRSSSPSRSDQAKQIVDTHAITLDTPPHTSNRNVTSCRLRPFVVETRTSLLGCRYSRDLDFHTRSRQPSPRSLLQPALASANKLASEAFSLISAKELLSRTLSSPKRNVSSRLVYQWTLGCARRHQRQA